jgi:hypothetical protein
MRQATAGTDWLQNSDGNHHLAEPQWVVNYSVYTHTLQTYMYMHVYHLRRKYMLSIIKDLRVLYIFGNKENLSTNNI